MASPLNHQGPWDAWTSVTNFAVETGFLNEVIAATSSFDLKNTLNSDLLCGLASLYNDHLPFGSQVVFFDELAPYDPLRPSHNQWTGFPGFLEELPKAFRLFIDYLYWAEIELPVEDVEPNEKDSTYGRHRWRSMYLQMQHDYPTSEPTRIAYCSMKKLSGHFLYDHKTGQEAELGYYIQLRIGASDYVRKTSDSFGLAAYLEEQE